MSPNPAKSCHPQKGSQLPLRWESVGGWVVFSGSLAHPLNSQPPVPVPSRFQALWKTETENDLGFTCDLACLAAACDV